MIWTGIDEKNRGHKVRRGVYPYSPSVTAPGKLKKEKN
jgi:hypothetical protein